MPDIKSNLTDALIKELILKNYGLEVDIVKKKIGVNLGTSNYYKLLSRTGDYYFLKAYSPYVSLQRIIEGVKLVDYLIEKNFPTAAILKTETKKCSFELEDRNACLQRFIDGKTYSGNILPNNILMHSAQLLGKLHFLLDGYEMKKRKNHLFPRWILSDNYLDISQKLNDMLIQIDNQDKKDLEQIKEDLKYLIDLCPKIVEKLHYFDEVTYASSHSDYIPGQFICDEKKIKAIIDFDDPAFMPVPFLLIRNYTEGTSDFINSDYLDVDNLNQYIEEYIIYSSKKLTYNDFKFMPYIALYFSFTNACFFYSQYILNSLPSIPKYIIKRVQYFDEEAEKLSKKLCEHFMPMFKPSITQTEEKSEMTINDINIGGMAKGYIDSFNGKLVLGRNKNVDNDDIFDSDKIICKGWIFNDINKSAFKKVFLRIGVNVLLGEIAHREDVAKAYSITSSNYLGFNFYNSLKYENLEKNSVSIIGLDSNGIYYTTPILASLNFLSLNNKFYKHKLYTEKPSTWFKHIYNDYYIGEETEIKAIEKGIILPLIKNDNYNAGIGGVCDADGNFIAGHKSIIDGGSYAWGFDRAYPIPDKIAYINEVVVYGGLVINHFGHFITGCLSRMWWFLKNPDCEYKFVFLTPHNQTDNMFLEYYYMLGIKKENIIILKEPTRFNSVIIPDQSTYFRSGYKSNAMNVYNAIRDSVPAASFDKVYFTRSKLRKQDTINEDYFENYFESMGYKVIAPEQHSIREQVAIMAGVKELACVSGSLHHHILFAHDGIKITQLNRSVESTVTAPLIAWINQARKAQFTAIDVYMNFLLDLHHNTTYLLMPTDYWKSYIKSAFNDSAEIVINKSEVVLEYIMQWAQRMKELGERALKEFMQFTFADIIINIHKYLMDTELDESTIKKLRDSFSLIK